MKAGRKPQEYNGVPSLIERVAKRLGVSAYQLRMAILEETRYREHDTVSLTVRRPAAMQREIEAEQHAQYMKGTV